MLGKRVRQGRLGGEGYGRGTCDLLKGDGSPAHPQGHVRNVQHDHATVRASPHQLIEEADVWQLHSSNEKASQSIWYHFHTFSLGIVHYISEG